MSAFRAELESAPTPLAIEWEQRPYPDQSSQLVVVEDPLALVRKLNPHVPEGWHWPKTQPEKPTVAQVFEFLQRQVERTVNKRLEELGPIFDEIIERQLATESIQNHANRIMVQQMRMLEA